MIATGLLPERALSDTLFSVSFPATLIHLDPDAIAGSMGYENGTMPEHFRGLLHDAENRALAISNVQAGYRLIAPPVPPSGKGHHIRIDSASSFDTGPKITSLMKGASIFCCFALTIGPAIDEWIHQLSYEQDFTGCYMANAVASAVAESAVELLHGHIRVIAERQSLSVSNRYSPGYCDWSVIDQHKLFGLFPERFCGISLTESALMIPIKSVSGIIALGPNIRFVEHDCDSCHHPNCTYREIRKAQAQRHTTAV